VGDGVVDGDNTIFKKEVKKSHSDKIVKISKII